MCLDSAGCFDRLCLPNCHACLSFTVDNLKGVADGAELDFGHLQRIVDLANEGCHLCLLLATGVLNSPRGNEFLPEASVTMKNVEVGRGKSQTSGKLDKVTFKFSNPLFLPDSYGLSQMASNWISWSIDLGLYSLDPKPDSVVSRKPADPQVRTPEAFQAAQKWIETCLDSHQNCPNQAQPPHLPTRVIDVRLETEEPADYVRLHISNGQRDRYSALSYSWGKTQQTRTLHENIKSHMTGILIKSLPQTIQDAIETTRKLKIPYLWIDSLCIIQDSFDDELADWPKEAAKMPQIYKNATITISAASATDCGDGFLEDRIGVKAAAQNALRLPLLGQPFEDPEDPNRILFSTIGDVCLCVDRELGFEVKKFDDEPINSRAWTLQESWLSPRLLVYGSGPLKWRCLSKNYTYGQIEENDDDDMIAGELGQRQTFFEARGAISHREASQGVEAINWGQTQDIRSSLLRQWFGLFIDYTRRNLTDPSDKLPAFSGIVSEFHQLLGDNYYAGLWSKTLPNSLLWRHDNRNFRNSEVVATIPRTSLSTKTKERLKKLFSKSRDIKKDDVPLDGINAKPYIAPSWSPFHNEYPVMIEYLDRIQPPSLATIQNISTTIANPSAPFGALSDGRMEIIAPMTRMNFLEIVEGFVIVGDGSPHMFWDWIMPDNGLMNLFLAPAAEVQIKNPVRNPQVLVQQKMTSGLSIDRIQEDDKTRSIPPNAIDRSFSTPFGTSARGKEKQKESELEKKFWLLEITHTNAPAGLVLIQIHDNVFKRIGMFRMGRDLSSETLWINGLYISGPRQWDWDGRLEMRKCIII